MVVAQLGISVSVREVIERRCDEEIIELMCLFFGISAVGEIGYDFFSLNPTLQNNNQRFYLFGRYDYYDSMFRNPEGKKDYTYAWCGRQRLAVGINYYPLREVAIKAEFAYGILNNGVRADGSVGKLYNDEPQLSVGITYAGLFRH